MYILPQQLSQRFLGLAKVPSVRFGQHCALNCTETNGEVLSVNAKIDDEQTKTSAKHCVKNFNIVCELANPFVQLSALTSFALHVN